MGNCLEPSESEIHKAKRAKIEKMAAREAAMASIGAPPTRMSYPYPAAPYNDPRMSGVYIPSPPPPQPSAYAVVDPQTGQGFIVPNQGAPMPTSAIPVRVPLVDDRAVYYGRDYYRQMDIVHSTASSRHKKLRGSNKNGDNNNNDERDGGKNRHSGQNGVVVGVEQKIDSSMVYIDKFQNNATTEIVATIDIHDNEHQKTHQNGDVRNDLFTNSGVMDLDAETETVIIDFLDPISQTTKKPTEPKPTEPKPTEPEPQSTRLSNIEYESAHSIPDTDHVINGNSTRAFELNGNSTRAFEPNGHSTRAFEPEVHSTRAFELDVQSTRAYEPEVHSTRANEPDVLVEPEDLSPADSPSPIENEYQLPTNTRENLTVRFLTNSITGKKDEVINYEEPDSPVGYDSAFSSTKMEIDIFPPKNFESEQPSPMPDILKRTLSQTGSSSLPSDPVDVVITYSVLGEYELDIVRRLTRQLELVGLSVWAERLGDSSKAHKSDKTAQAILGATMLIVMLSEGSCGQRFIRDHVAIATMINISIFPVVSEPPKQVKDSMPKELKVQLAPYAWTELVVGNEDRFLFQLRSLARSVQDEVEERSSLASKGDRKMPRGNLQSQKSLTNQGMTDNASNFWDVHFGYRDRVKWERLEYSLKDAFKMFTNDIVSEDLQPILFTAIRNRITGTSSDVKKSDFVDLCQSIDNKDTDVWGAIVQVAGMIQAVRDVFNIDSTVRHLAVQHNEHFTNPSVVIALRDLLSDPDPNFRSVAVVTLARCMEVLSDLQYLDCVERTLEDSDRLVREAGCLALGHLRAESAVQKLIHVWRNDVISHVREAAQMSLDQIGGEEVMDAMRVTGVLANEIRDLTDAPQYD